MIILDLSYCRRAFFALYLPISINGRVSDIWRSYIAQTIFKLCNIRVGFPARPLVVQVRNAHNLNVRFRKQFGDN